MARLPFIGYMDPNWKGVAWAPTGAAALRTSPWVIEGSARQVLPVRQGQLYIDTVSYQGAWNRKFGWKGELLAIHQVMAWNPMPFTRPDGKVDYNQGSNQAYQTVENIKMNRATVAGIKSGPDRLRKRYVPASAPGQSPREGCRWARVDNSSRSRRRSAGARAAGARGVDHRDDRPRGRAPAHGGHPPAEAPVMLR